MKLFLEIQIYLKKKVACGPFNEKFYADYNANILPKGTLCTKGCGRVAPPESRFIILDLFLKQIKLC